MEWLEKLVLELAQKSPELVLGLSAAGTLVVLATVVIAATPTKADDAWLSKLQALPMVGWAFSLFERFSLVQRKPAPPALVPPPAP